MTNVVVVDNIMPYLHQIFNKKCLTDVIDKYNIFYCEFRILEKNIYYFYSNTVDLVHYVTLTFHHITLYQLRNSHIFNIYFVKFFCNVLDSLRKCGECNGNYLKKPFWDFPKVL